MPFYLKTASRQRAYEPRRHEFKGPSARAARCAGEELARRDCAALLLGGGPGNDLPLRWRRRRSDEVKSKKLRRAAHFGSAFASSSSSAMATRIPFSSVTTTSHLNLCSVAMARQRAADADWTGTARAWVRRPPIPMTVNRNFVLHYGVGKKPAGKWQGDVSS